MSSSSEDYHSSETGPKMKRRTLLKGAAGGAAALAGCSTDKSEAEKSKENEHNEPGGEYSLSFNFLEEGPQYDLTTLGSRLLDEYEEEDVEEEYSAEAELRILEGNRALTFEEIDQLHLEDEYGREIAGKEEITQYAEKSEQGYILKLPEFLTEDGMNLTATTRNGETLVQENISVNKKLPEEGVKLEMHRDGEHITELEGMDTNQLDNYRTPFRFDTNNIHTKTYQNMMMQDIRDKSMNEVVKISLKNKRHNFRPEIKDNGIIFEYSHGDLGFDSEHFSNIDPTNIKQIVNDGTLAAFKYWINNSMGGPPSGSSEHMVATTSRLIDAHINELDPDQNRFRAENIEIDMRPGFSNSSRGHGHGPMYIKGNDNPWLVFDPDGAIKKPANVADAEDNSVFFAGANYEAGEMNTVSYVTKKERGIRVMANPYSIPDVSRLDIGADDNWLDNATDLPANDEPIPDTMAEVLKQVQWAAKTKEFDFNAIYGGDIDKSSIFMTNDDISGSFRVNPEPVSTEKLENGTELE